VLSRKETNFWYPEHFFAKKHKSLQFLGNELWPKFMQALKNARNETHSYFSENSRGEPKELDCLRTYWLFCKNEFNVLEVSDRAKKRLPLVDLVRSKKRAAEEPIQNGRSKRKAILYEANVTCTDKGISRGGKKAKHSCRICGYAISTCEVKKVTI